MRATTILLAILITVMVIVTLGIAARRTAPPGEQPRRIVEFRIDINHADEPTLALLPGIGPAIAHRIIDHRRQHGPFPNIEALTQVPGIGPRTLERLREFASCSQPPQQ